MTSCFPIILEGEANGTVSAYVIEVPGVFAAAESERAAARAISATDITVTNSMASTETALQTAPS